MEYTVRPRGVCSMQIKFEIDDNGSVKNGKFLGGCNGNSKGISALAEGMEARDLIARLRGIDCNGKGTSCPDQLARAVEEAVGR